MAPPFLSYLTVFKSRLGVANLVLDATGLVHQPDAALLRKLKSYFSETKVLSLADPANARIFQYLSDKHLISREPRTRGRYSAYSNLEEVGDAWVAHDRQGIPVSEIRTFLTDVWFSHPDVPSTIGVPTPDNVAESFELVFQLRLLSKSKNTWTAAGQMTHELRSHFASLIADPSNPFLMGVEAPALLRQVVSADGLLLREVVREIIENSSERVTRDDVAEAFPGIVDRAVSVARQSNLSPQAVREALDFLRLIRSTADKRDRAVTKGGSVSRAPGVLEHRVAPRLEWLTDFGYLNKTGLPKNGFEYNKTDALPSLLADLDSSFSEDNWADEVAASQWVRNPTWNRLRAEVAIHPSRSSFLRAYNVMRRRIGPAPLREVAFVAGLICDTHRTFRTTVEELIDFARVTKGATLSGGRYSRAPENIFIAEPGRFEDA
jgi:hypothetical protein